MVQIVYYLDHGQMLLHNNILRPIGNGDKAMVTSDVGHSHIRAGFGKLTLHQAVFVA